MDNDLLLDILKNSREYISPDESPRTAQLISIVEQEIKVGKELDAKLLFSHLIVALSNIEKASNQ